MLLPDGYIKRKTSTIPFGYEFDDLTGYLKPIEEQLIALSVAEIMVPVSYTHLRAHETRSNLVCRLLLEKKN